MLKSSGAMGAATMISRMLGMVREMVYARFMGDGLVASAFVFAFQIPNLFRRLLGEGALSAAFIPIFKEKEITEGERKMWETANAAVSALVVAGSMVVFLIAIGISISLKVGNFSMKTQLFLELLLVMSPYVLMVCVAAVFMGMLNARGHFFIPAMGATTLNVVMIAAVLFLAPRMGETLEEQIFGLAIGALIAGIAQMLFQVPLLMREGFRPKWVTPWNNETVRMIVRRMLPGIVGVAAFQINVIFTQWIAFFVGNHVVASYNFAVRLMEFPQGLFGISLAAFLLPTLAGLAAEKKFDDFNATLRQGMDYLIFANLIATTLTFVLAEPIVRLLFEGNRFGPDSTQRAAIALVWLIPGLVSFSLVNVLARAFFAMGDVKTPMYISVFCLTANVLFSLILIPMFLQGGMGAANTLTSFLNLGLLTYAIRRKLKRLSFRPLLAPILSNGAAAILAAVVAWYVRGVWEVNLGHESLRTKLGEVFVPLLVGVALYWGMTLWLRVSAAWEILGLLKSMLDKRSG